MPLQHPSAIRVWAQINGAHSCFDVCLLFKSFVDYSMRFPTFHLLFSLLLGLGCVNANADQLSTPFRVDGEQHGYDLVTHRGAPFDPSTVSDKVVLLVFGFTTCPDICPTELARVSQVLSEFEGQAVGALFVTLDPDRDSVQSLASYLPYFHADITGLTGDHARISELASALGVRFSRVEQDSGYTIDHSTGVFIIGGDGEVRAIAPIGSGVDHLKRIVAGLL